MNSYATQAGVHVGNTHTHTIKTKEKVKENKKHHELVAEADRARLKLSPVSENLPTIVAFRKLEEENHKSEADWRFIAVEGQTGLQNNVLHLTRKLCSSPHGLRRDCQKLEAYTHKKFKSGMIYRMRQKIVVFHTVAV